MPATLPATVPPSVPTALQISEASDESRTAVADAQPVDFAHIALPSKIAQMLPP